MTKGFIIDAVERIVWTAIQAFLATLIASPVFDNLGLGWQEALKVAAFAALLSVAKNIIALNVGNDNTGQLGADTYVNQDPV